MFKVDMGVLDNAILSSEALTSNTAIGGYALTGTSTSNSNITIGSTGRSATISSGTFDNTGNYTLSNGVGFSTFSQGSIFTHNPQTNMKTKQTKVAVFTVTRKESDNSIETSKFLKELWVEVPANISLDLLVAKELGVDFDPLTTVVREIYSVTF